MVSPQTIAPPELKAMKKHTTDSITQMTQPVKVNADVMRSVLEGVVRCSMSGICFQLVVVV